MIITYPSQRSKIPSLSHYPLQCLFSAAVESLNPGIKKSFFFIKKFNEKIHHQHGCFDACLKPAM